MVEMQDLSDSDGGGDEDPSDSDGGGGGDGGDEDHGDSGDGELGGAGANNAGDD